MEGNSKGVKRKREDMGTEVFASIAKQQELDMSECIAARMAEVDAMYEASVSVHGNARIMQNLPRHMRRRAANHNIKRLPRNVRHIAARETINNAPKKTKRPSRRHRRRPGNLLSEYQRRQRTHVWLETHIWHAKRFHMTELWGYKIPHFDNNKGFRACRTAVSEYCMMWDISYMCCIEIEGCEEDIVQPMKRLISQEQCLGVGSTRVLDGSREGDAVMYKHDSFPYSAIGPVKFMWKPHSDRTQMEAPRRMWLWVHPSCYMEILEELKVVFNAEKQETPESNTENEPMEVCDEETGDGDENKSQENIQEANGHQNEAKADKAEKTDQQKTEFSRGLFNPEYRGDCVTFRSLKDTLCRYRLIGPKSWSILNESFKRPAAVKSDCDQQKQSVNSDMKKCDAAIERYWWEEYRNEEEVVRESGAWGHFHSEPCVSNVRSKSVIGFTVRDPRLFLPKKITKTELPASVAATKPVQEWSNNNNTWSDSPLWEKEIRTKVKDTKLTEHQLNISRSQCVKGIALNLGASESQIPVILVHQEASPLPPYLGSGYDVILPAGWGMAFWIALVYRGARTGGLREMQQMDLELGRQHFMRDYPDTTSGKNWAQSEAKEAKETYDKKPPAKRVNIEKLATAHHAFQIKWDDLLETNKLGNAAGDVFVLRSQKVLSQLSKAVEKADVSLLPLNDTLNLGNALIPVRVTPVSRGVPSARASICLPSSDDLASLQANPKFPGPSEPIHNVPNANKKSKTENPPKEQKGISSCIRSCVGYVTEGNNCLSIGRGRGLGFISFAGIKQLLQTQKARPLKVLIRGVTETIYRLHSVDIVH